VATITTQFTGEFKSNPAMQARFMELVRSPSGGFSL
jgi:GTP cyclohydrolase IA